jgi:hypothetical protein
LNLGIIGPRHLLARAIGGLAKPPAGIAIT